MYKDKYENTEIEIIEFLTEDILSGSPLNPDDEYEGELAH